MSSPCAACTRACCRHYLVTVSGYDAWVIATGLRLAPEQFLQTVPQPTPNGRGFYLDTSGLAYDLALDKQRVEEPERPCVFWLPLPGGLGRCGIYPLRPFVCQTYPAFWDGTAVGRRGDVLCPDDAWLDGTLQRPVWRERVLRMYVEFDIYGLAVARWNLHVPAAAAAGPISPLAFYTYLMHYYAALEPLRASVAPAAWPDLLARWVRCLHRHVSPLAGPLPEFAPWADFLTGVRAVADSFFPAVPA